MVGPITTGKDFNYFQEISVTDTTFPSEPQVKITFRGPQKLRFILESGTNVEYSFNGDNGKIHGNLKTAISNDLYFDTRNNKFIWFRCSASATVRIEAWGI